MSSRNNHPTASLAMTVLRIVIGGLFLAHGAQKLFDWGPSGTGDSFEQMGAPLAQFTGPAVGVLELGGGALLVLGLFTRVLGALLTVDMLGAIFVVHGENGIFVDGGGYELVAALGAGALALAIGGAGDWSLDRAIFRRRR